MPCVSSRWDHGRVLPERRAAAGGCSYMQRLKLFSQRKETEEKTIFPPKENWWNSLPFLCAAARECDNGARRCLSTGVPLPNFKPAEEGTAPQADPPIFACTAFVLLAWLPSCDAVSRCPRREPPASSCGIVGGAVADGEPTDSTPLGLAPRRSAV